MVSVDYVKKLVEKTKESIRECIKKNKYDDALTLISVCADVLYLTNIYYEDDQLEEYTNIISEKLVLIDKETETYNADEECVLFFDGFGLNERGLIQIYLKALCKIKKVIYVTYEDRKSLIPDVEDILSYFNCEQRYIERLRKPFGEQIKQLNDIVKEFCPQKMFLYAYPSDVVAVSIMYAYKDLIIRYQINLTDHAFWIGAGCVEKCVEFRNYGAKISKEYRGISEEKIVIIPFYPITHKEKEFQGFPFDMDESKMVIFSGGNLYKTLSADNKYYEVVDHILAKHSNTVFWYAGFGDDSELKKIMARYPGRVFLTAERSDLLQVLENCDMYLSTYPMCGGLMFQYAAMSGCVPVTLKSGNISDDFLINQANIGVEFENVNELYGEVDKLLTDKDYSRKRGALMRQSVIAPDAFEKEVEKLVLETGVTLFPADFKHIDTKAFRQWYLDEISREDVDAMFVQRRTVKLGIRQYPLRFLRGGIHRAKKVILKKLM